MTAATPENDETFIMKVSSFSAQNGSGDAARWSILRALLELGDRLTRSQVQKVLEQLGVRSLYPVDIIKHHNIPQFKAWKVSCVTHLFVKLTILPINYPVEYR